MDENLIKHIKMVIFNSLEDSSGYKSLHWVTEDDELSVIDGTYNLSLVAERVIEAVKSYKHTSLDYPPEFVEALKYDQALKEYPPQNSSNEVFVKHWCTKPDCKKCGRVSPLV